MANGKALITGASSGIGLELARQFAQHGHPLLITARIESELEDIARELETQHGVRVNFLAQDLELPEAAENIYAAAREQGEPVEFLVNNAGLGYYGKFWETPLDAHLAMIRVNLEAVTRITRLFLPDMIERNSGRILNTASVAGFEPGPLMATYHATKAFVLSLSESLAEELKETNITVTALCPGITDTDFIPKAGMTETNIFQRGNLMAPQEVAENGYEAFMAGDPLYVVGGGNKAQVFATRFLTKSAQAKASKKMYEKAPPEKRKRQRGDVEYSNERKKAA